MSEWRTMTIGEAVTLQRGIDITKTEQRPGSVPVVSSGGISSYHDTAAVVGPGVVIGRKGALGTTFYLDADYWPHDTTLWVKDFKGSLPRFVYYFFLNLDVKSLDVGSANPTLNRNHVHPIAVRWPDRSTQEGIASVLGTLDDKIAVNDRIAESGEQLATSLGSEELWQATVPLIGIVGWAREQLSPESVASELVAHYSIPAFDKARLPEYVAPVTIKSSKFRIDAPAVLISKLNPSIPRTWNVRMKSQVPALASTEFLVLRPNDGISTDDVWVVCSQPRFISQLAEKATGTSNSHQRVNPSDLLASEVVDPRELSSEVRASVSSLAQQVHEARIESVTLARLRDLLLPKLMSGAIRVRDAERIVEDAT